MFRMIVVSLLAGLSAVCLAGEDPAPVPAHGRPFFMPESRRIEILKTIAEEDWAKNEHQRVCQSVMTAHGLLNTPAFIRRQGWEREAFWAAFLYALEGKQEYLDVARAWLKHSYGEDSRFTKRADDSLKDPKYWAGSEQGVDWYRLDIDAYVAYDWIYNGLSAEDRDQIHEWLRLQTEYRMACMDSWGSTPNLNFKPVFMVAFAAMALQDEHIVDWGWRRTERQGNFHSMMDKMLKDGGAWHEAAIYAVAHNGLYCVNTMAFYRSLLEGRNWFNYKTLSGASARGMTDYFIDTAYPVERTGEGNGRIRVVTYGDGATSPPRDGGGEHDMFIGGDHPKQAGLILNMRDGLAMAYAASADDRYAPLLALYPEYEPNLWDRPSLPEAREFPPAPSRILAEFGLAMLRSDESAEYWTDPDAIAAFLMMTKRYGHEQPDKFHLNLFGANRLLYPDYLRMQYENRAMGWTYTSASQNTMLVDELDTSPAEPHIRSDFTPQIKLLAVSATDVFPSVDQTRALMLTDGYLLDLFQASSKTPRTYDYVLHSMGLPRPVDPQKFEAQGNISRKYWAIDNPRKTTTSDQWSLEFVIDEQEPAEPVPGLGTEWYEHEAKVRVTMAADDPTQVCYGTWGDGKYVDRAVKVYASANEPSPVHREMAVQRVRKSADRVGMLVARREGRRSTVFAVTHEPYANRQMPAISAVTKLAETESAIVVRVDARDFTDYAAVAWGAKGGEQRYALETDDGQVFIFRNYGWLRVPRKGTPVARGGWEAFRVAGTAEKLMLNGNELDPIPASGKIAYGDIPKDLPRGRGFAPECPLRLELDPPEPLLSMIGERQVCLSVTNTLDEAVSGSVEFDTSSGLSIKPDRMSFGPLKADEACQLVTTLAPGDAPEGKEIVPFRIVYRTADDAEVVTAWEPLPVILSRYVEPDLSTEFVSQMFRGPELTARFETSGLITYLADVDGTVRLDGHPLYTITDAAGVTHFGKDRPVAPSIWFGLNAAAASHHKIDGCRVTMTFLEDRISPIGLNRVYSRQPEYIFDITDNWVSPTGKSTWKRIIATDEAGKEFDAAPGADAPIVAMELAFPGASRNIAFSFDPARRIKLDGLRMQFKLPRDAGNHWAVGFCRPNGLDEWRKR
ncbi:MAG: hypothetical protein ISR77_30780 [Pirellulaceae bacterium]|nr:hypothetical protein [Pirellulaceae bacterium]